MVSSMIFWGLPSARKTTLAQNKKYNISTNKGNEKNVQEIVKRIKDIK